MIRKIFTPSENSLLAGYTHRSTSRKSPAHWLPAVMLVWTSWLFFVPMFQTDGTFRHWLWPTAASFIVFLWLFYRIYYRDRAQQLQCALAIGVLGLALTPLNPGAQSYIIYGCAYLVTAGPHRIVFPIIAVLLAIYAVEWLGLQFDWPYLINGVLISLAIAFMNFNFMRKQQREAELYLSNEEVRRLAATAERERIGRDLHDLLGHTLSLITLKSELANKLFDRDSAAAKREMADVERVAREALAQVRRAVTGIRAAGFAAELASAKLLLESNGVHLHYTLAEIALPVDIETVLAMALREAVTNIQRHARATQARVVLESVKNNVTLRIEDNGRGGAIVPGNGLAGMRERLTFIGAQLSIESQRGVGTTLGISVALPQTGEIASQETVVLRTV